MEVRHLLCVSPHWSLSAPHHQADRNGSDNAHGRIFTTEIADNSGLTVESCINTCAGQGFSIAGMEYSGEPRPILATSQAPLREVLILVK